MTTTFQLVGEVDTDSRRRIPLASLKLHAEPNARYRVEEGPSGELRLIPVFSVSASELALLSDPAALKRVNENLDAAAAGELDDFDPTAALDRLRKLRANHSD